LEGCTLTGGLSVTTEVTDGVTIIHGPAGCSQHNASLIHATLLDHDIPHLLRIHSSNLDEAGVIFGGEGALAACIREAAGGDPSAIFVLSTCVVQTIGDDVGGVCRRGWGVPVIPIPSSGFLGGGFQDGMRNALIALGDTARDREDHDRRITVVGEKNLEDDVEENFREVSRLLALLDEQVSLRFVRGIRGADIQEISRGRLNILREPELRAVGEAFAARFGTPFIGSFPVGLSGSLQFIEETAGFLGLDPVVALEEERAFQEEALAGFEDLRGELISISTFPGSGRAECFTAELAASLDLRLGKGGASLPLPSPLPVGTGGLVRLLHRWRRVLHA
ncbi:MAG: nitrogenase component 1, partial [Methanomicrobiales archaeon]|nr:nitrogenase component 1 [Methanomicrobiales archaeon]